MLTVAGNEDVVWPKRLGGKDVMGLTPSSDEDTVSAEDMLFTGKSSSAGEAVRRRRGYGIGYVE